MKTVHPVRSILTNVLPALLLALFLTACGGETEPETDTAGMDDTEEMNRENMGAMQAAPPAVAAEPRMEDGVQVVDVTVGQMGYEPQEIRLQAGVPARLVFTREIEGDCPSQVQVPAFDVAPTDLPMNEQVAVEFTPDEAGTFQFVCGMDMMKGTLVVSS
ncbi:MAG: cupredoxin domain-containing protein [Rhodothermales bacterium]